MFSSLYSPLKRFYKFILKRLIGNFLKNELDLEQLDVQLGAGVVQLKNLELNIDVRSVVVVCFSGSKLMEICLCWSFLHTCPFVFLFQVLNGVTEDLPLSFIRGTIGNIKATIPWRNILHEPCKVELDGLELTLSPSCELKRPGTPAYCALSGFSLILILLCGGQNALASAHLFLPLLSRISISRSCSRMFVYTNTCKTLCIRT